MIKSDKVGEVFICSSDTNGTLERIDHFLGKPLSGIGVGGLKIFVLQEGNQNQGVISTINSQRNFYENQNPQEHEIEESKQKLKEKEENNKEKENQNAEKIGLSKISENQILKDSNQINEIKKEGAILSNQSSRQLEINDQNVENASQNMGYLIQISAGKQHILHLNADGFVYSYGGNLFSATGHGGAFTCETPKLLKVLANRKVQEISCGEFHSIALTNINDVYSWGRGFEGQLGLGEKIPISSKPLYLNSFSSKKIIHIAAGAYYSLAVTSEGSLYGWGEAKMGQLGIGKHRIVWKPSEICVKTSEEDLMRMTSGSKIEIESHSSVASKIPIKVSYCAAGFGHTAAITEEGELFIWGLNSSGQLGVGDKKARFFPVKVEKEVLQHLLPKAKIVACGSTSTFMIDVDGNIYSWGKGYIGHGGITIEEFPRKIEKYTENRIFTAVHSNEQAVIFYAPMRVISIFPPCGPASGGTLLNIIGTGFNKSNSLKVKFTYGDKKQYFLETEAEYDFKVQGIYCRTPKFIPLNLQGSPEEKEKDKENKSEEMKFPQLCCIQVTFDGINFATCSQEFLIYADEIRINTIHPKSGSIEGGTALQCVIELDQLTAKFLFYLTIGFQSRGIPIKNQPKIKPVEEKKNSEKPEESKEEKTDDKKVPGLNKCDSKKEIMRRSATRSISGLSGNVLNQAGKPVNPLEISPEDQQLEMDEWKCTPGQYQNGKISCIVPKLTVFDPECLQYNVDISLNGQQFSGAPVIFRFFDVHITEVEPKFGPSEGGTNILIKGSGFYDSSSKKIKFINEFGERFMQTNWDRDTRSFSCLSPPLSWIFGGKAKPTNEADILKSLKCKIFLTLNSQEWIFVSNYEYFDPIFQRLSIDHDFGLDLNEEEKNEKWLSEEPIPVIPENEEEKAAYLEKKAEKEAEETEYFNISYLRNGKRIYIYGKNFMKTPLLKVKFVQGDISHETNCVFKNSQKIGFLLTDMVSFPIENNTLQIFVSFNGTQFTNTNLKLLYNPIDRNMTPDQIKKLDDQETKARKTAESKKKAPAKNKK